MDAKKTYFGYRNFDRNGEGVNKYMMIVFNELDKFDPNVSNFLDNAGDDFWEIADHLLSKRIQGTMNTEEKMRILGEITLEYMKSHITMPSMAEMGKPPSKIIIEHSDGSVIYYEGEDAARWMKSVNNSICISSVHHSTFNGPQPKYDLSGMK